jgi:hypothetical protein
MSFVSRSPARPDHFLDDEDAASEGDPIRITGAQLAKGMRVKLQAQTVDFLEISDPKAVYVDPFSLIHLLAFLTSTSS